MAYNATDTPDLSGVTSMHYMFSTSSFNGDISDWDVSSAKYASGMFKDATSLNQPLENWSVSSSVETSYMFDGATTFTQDLSWLT